MSEELAFLYCQKLVVLSADHTAVLLARRKGEADFDGVYSLIGGKMETADSSLIEGMRREKNEEVGTRVRLKIIPNESYNLLFRRNDGSPMILPHIAAEYIDGEVTLNEEYHDYVWVPLTELDVFEPKINTIPQVTYWALQKLDTAKTSDFVII